MNNQERLPPKLTVQDVVKRFTSGSKWKFVCTCNGKSLFGMKSGQSYEYELTVHKVKRIRRQWEDPGKEIVFEVAPTEASPTVGYMSVTTNELQRAKITDEGGFIRTVYSDDKNVTRDYYQKETEHAPDV